MAIELTDRVCVVTGAGEGVGRGLVQGFLKRGARVVAGVRNLEKSAAGVAPAHPIPTFQSEYDVGGVVEIPVPMQQTTLGLHLAK